MSVRYYIAVFLPLVFVFAIGYRQSVVGDCTSPCKVTHHETGFAPPVQQANLISALIKLLVMLFEEFPKIIKSIGEGITNMFSAVGDAIVYIIKGIGNGFEWIFKLFSRETEAEKIIRASDSLFSKEILSAEEVPEAFQPYFNEQVSVQVDIFGVIPKTEEQVKSIFGNTENPASVVAEADILSNSIQSLAGSSILKRSHLSGESVWEFEEFIKTSESDILFVIGHNEGGEFVFASGERAGIDKLCALSTLYSKRCVLLSCNSARYIPDRGSMNYGLSRELSFLDAEKIVSGIISELEGHHTTSMQNLGEILRIQTHRADNNLVWKPRVRVIVVTSGISSGVAIVVSLDEIPDPADKRGE